jgi:thiol-disulfide isomerase/thioredoxin
MNRRDFVGLLAGTLLVPGAALGQGRAVGEGSLVPDVPVRRVDGTIFRLSELRKEVLLLNFWATWCGPCMQELPLLESLFKKLERVKGIRMLAVNVDEGVDPAALGQFWKKSGYSLPIACDPAGQAAAAFGLYVLPMSFISDSAGKVRFAISGARDWSSDQWVRGLEALRDGKAP